MVYLIHFARPYKRVSHYIGFVEGDLDKRIEKHRSGCGAKLLRAVAQAGILFWVVRVWWGESGSRTTERKLKNRKRARMLCPICNPHSCQANGQGQ